MNLVSRYFLTLLLHVESSRNLFTSETTCINLTSSGMGGHHARHSFRAASFFLANSHNSTHLIFLHTIRSCHKAPHRGGTIPGNKSGLKLNPPNTRISCKLRATSPQRGVCRQKRTLHILRGKIGGTRTFGCENASHEPPENPRSTFRQYQIIIPWYLDPRDKIYETEILCRICFAVMQLSDARNWKIYGRFITNDESLVCSRLLFTDRIIYDNLYTNLSECSENKSLNLITFLEYLWAPPCSINFLSRQSQL